MSYVVMKLVTGEEIIGKYLHQSETSAHLDNPLVVKYRYGSIGPPSVTLARFSVFATEKQVEIKKNNIVAEFEPVPLLIEYYLKMVEYLDMIYGESMVEDLEAGIKALEESIEKKKSNHIFTDEEMEALFDKIQVKGALN